MLRVPRAHPDRAGQPGHRPVPRRGPHAVQRLHRGLPGQHRPRPARRRRPVHACWSAWPRSAGDRAHPVAHPRGPAAATARPSTRCRCSSLKIVGAGRRRDVPSSCSWPGSRTCPGCWCCSPSLVHRLHAADQPGGVRPAHLRRRRQPAGRRAVRRQGQVGHVLDLREHGRAGRASPGSIFAGRLNQAGPDGGQQLRAGRHRGRVHRRRGRAGRRRQGRRRDHRRPDHGRDQQRDVADRRAERAGHAGQGAGAARRGRLRRVDQAPRAAGR